GVYRVNGARRCPLMVAGPVRWWKKPEPNATDSHHHFAGPPGRVGLATGRVGAEKGAFFDFYGTITTSVSY
ncbi:hypothetical protein, partial [Escherichia coli]|uniref:hypothetical protein n=1 Tax=Escherichia coli TaxID=562 RepID=UPI001C5D9E3C